MFEETGDKYAVALEGFLAMLLRPQGEYRTPYPLPLKNAIAELDTAVAKATKDLPVYIDKVLSQIWQVQWKTTATHHVPDPTERFIMLKSLNLDGSWGDVRNVTPLLAKFKHLMRIHFLRVIAENDEDDQDAAYAQLERWCKEGVSSSFDTVSDLQHRASSLAMQAQGPINLYWTDDVDKMVLRYKGDEISLDGLRNMFAHIQQDAKRIWEEEVMLGTGLSVKYDYIKEDLENRKSDYCFLEDKRNSFANHRLTLVQHIVQDPALRARFCHMQDGRLLWRPAALMTWLQSYIKLNGLHLLQAETLTGGPGRGTELTAMQHRSSPTRGVRNLISIGGHMVLLRTYGKTSSRSGNDRFVPSGAPGCLENMLVQDLTLARPFAEFIAAQCFASRPEVLHKYRYNLFVNTDKFFTTTDLSRIMVHYTLQYLHADISVRDWRHICIAIRRKLCPSQISLYDDEEDNIAEDHIAAEQAGHTVRTERLRYAITADALAGPSEDVLPLFLQASNNWQQVMKVVPGTFL